MMRKWLLRLVYAGLVLAPIAGYANYQLGQCTVSCTGFASAVVATIHYAQVMLTDATGVDVSDTTNHAIKVNVVAGGAGGGAVTNAGTFATQLTGATNNINNVSGTVSLPTGAATSALQTTGNTSLTTINTTLGTPMQASGGTVTATQATGTNLHTVVDSATGLAQASTTSGQTGSMIMGAVTTGDPAYTTAQTAYASIDVKGHVRTVLGGGVPETISATGTTGATTATLATGAATTTYICGFSIRANATAAATGNATVTGVINGTMNYTQWTAPNASGVGVTEELFSPCIPASAANTSIAVVSAAPGTGGVVSVSAWGYQQ